MFYRLLVNVDDFGRLDARPAVVRSKCFPLKDTINNKEVADLLAELQRIGLILLYESNACAYLQMLKWDNIPRAKESKFPAPDDTCIQMYTSARKPCTVLPVTVTGTGTVKPEPRTETGTETGVGAASVAKSARGSRLSQEWLLPKPWGEWALQERPQWTAEDVRRCADRFRDYWIAKTGKDATKADWEATWRNWVRKDYTPTNGIDVRFMTPMQRKIAATDKAIDEWLNEGSSGTTVEGECREG